MRRIAVFAPVGTLDHQTGILNAIRCFSANGYEVEVLTVRNMAYALPSFDSRAVTVRCMPWRFNSEREPRALVTILFALWVLATLRPRPQVIFAGGIRGLLAAYLCSFFWNTRIVNYQTELYVGRKLDTWAARLFKALERRAAQSSGLTIEHDHERRDLLVQDLRVRPERVVVVPNAPIGPARARATTLLHARLGLEPGIRLLLCPGTMGDAFETSNVVRAAQCLPDGWRCVLHSAQPRREHDPYLESLRKLDAGQRVLLSLTPVPYEQIDDLLGSARVGIALYSSSGGANYSSVGLASGKLSHFLKVGVPVIVSPLPGLADFVRRHGVGEVLQHPSQLGELVGRIDADWSGYSARALRCFDEHLSFERAFQPVIDATDAWFECRTAERAPT